MLNFLETFNITDAFQKLIDNSSLHVIVLDKDELIHLINKPFADFCEKTSGEKNVIGKKYSEILKIEPEQDLFGNYTSKVVESLRTGIEFENERWIKLNGETIYINTKTNLIRDSNEEVIGIICFLKDLTKEKIDEQSYLTIEKQALLGKLAAGIAHEIRNPLTAANGFIQLLLNSTVDEKQRKYLQYIAKEHQAINELVSEFMMLAKPSVTDFQELSITEILNETIDFMSGQAILNGLIINRLHTDIEAYILGDRNQIKQVFMNLIRNAIEASNKPGSKITISCKIINGVINIMVKDKGVGIPQHNISKIFDAFFTTKKDGTGIGLTGVYQIIKNHHGDISVKSNRGEGTKFVITLPLVAHVQGSFNIPNPHFQPPNVYTEKSYI